MEYFTTFVPVPQLFSDQGPHFHDKVMQTLASSLEVKQRFSTVYAPWSKAKVEPVCKEIPCLMPALNSETHAPEAHWSNSVQAIQSIINKSSSRRLGGRAPITVHTGMPSGNVTLTQCKVRNVESIVQTRLQQRLSTEEFLESLKKMHKYVYQTLSASRNSAVDRHSAKTHVVPYKPTVGYYVVFRSDAWTPHLYVHELGRNSQHLPHPVGLDRRDCPPAYQTYTHRRVELIGTSDLK